jgi:cell wall-associated NlpC family hydrolase
MTKDFGKYVGIPFLERGRSSTGCDCWGLIRLILLQEFSLFIPSLCHLYLTTSDVRKIEQVYRDAPERNYWRRIETRDANPGDLIVLRLGGHACHFGVYIGDMRFIHTHAGIDSCIESLDSIRWRTKIVEVLRHRSIDGGSS